MKARLDSIQVGVPTEYKHADGDWTSAIFKTAVDGPVDVHPTGIEGDGQADLEHHGGVDKSVLAYSGDHYPLWNEELALDFTGGAFGENLTVLGLSESDVCIGDQLRIGSAVFQVSQPRQPCWKLGRMWDNNQLPKLVVQTGRSGWYLRVIQTGTVSPADVITRESRMNPDWSIAQANRVLYGNDSGAKHELASVAELADSWKQQLRK